MSHPEAICDGTLDCEDETDERNCCNKLLNYSVVNIRSKYVFISVNCPKNNYHCQLSKKCIPNYQKCDHKADCSFGEDEWDCCE